MFTANYTPQPLPPQELPFMVKTMQHLQTNISVFVFINTLSPNESGGVLFLGVF